MSRKGRLPRRSIPLGLSLLAVLVAADTYGQRPPDTAQLREQTDYGDFTTLTYTISVPSKRFILLEPIPLTLTYFFAAGNDPDGALERFANLYADTPYGDFAALAVGAILAEQKDYDRARPYLIKVAQRPEFQRWRESAETLARVGLKQ